ncbi:MAG: tetratricopeptide repeat protein, partial [Cyanobacteria bacterium]|nr:tetratricopeptide repeat protein [Cyanobacteriota bacterium]
ATVYTSLPSIHTAEEPLGETTLLDAPPADAAKSSEDSPEGHPSLAASLYSAKNPRAIAQAEKYKSDFLKVAQLAKKQRQQEFGGNFDTAEDTTTEDAFLWYFNNGNDFFADGRFAEAEPEYLRALELLKNLPTYKEKEEYILLENLGDIYVFLDRVDQAVQLYETTKELRVTARIPESKYLSALLKLGSAELDRGEIREAESHYRKASEVAAAILPVDDPLLDRINEDCLRLAREKSTLLSRFNPAELKKLHDPEYEVSIVHRRARKTIEDETKSKQDIWINKEKAAGDTESGAASSRRVIVTSTITAVVAFAFAFVLLVPLQTNRTSTTNSQAADAVMTKYSSCDGRKTIELKSDGKAWYTFDGKATTAGFAFVGNSLLDMFTLLPGHLRAEYVYFQDIGEGLVDADGTGLYTRNAPESRLVGSMWDYARVAEMFRNEKDIYPDKIEDLRGGREKSTYLNPFSKQTEEAAIVGAVSLGSKYLPDKVAAGQGWPGQPPPRPGEILANSFSGRLFFLRGYDRNGQLLTSAEPERCFFILLRDGLNVTKQELHTIASNTTLDISKHRYIFVRDYPDFASHFLLLRTVVPVLLVVILAFFGGAWKSKSNKGEAKPLDVVPFVVSALIVLAWYIVAFVDVI